MSISVVYCPGAIYHETRRLKTANTSYLHFCGLGICVWLSLVGPASVAESLLRSQIRSWLGLQHLKAQRGIRNSFQTQQLAVGQRPHASQCRPDREHLGVLPTWHWLHSKQAIQERKQGGHHEAFYDLSSEVPQNHLCHMQCIKVSHCIQYTLRGRKIGLHL